MKMNRLADAELQPKEKEESVVAQNNNNNNLVVVVVEIVAILYHDYSAYIS